VEELEPVCAVGGVRHPQHTHSNQLNQDNKLEKLLDLVGDLFELYDDART
jgi:hypothetical protein